MSLLSLLSMQDGLKWVLMNINNEIRNIAHLIQNRASNFLKTLPNSETKLPNSATLPNSEIPGTVLTHIFNYFKFSTKFV